MDPSDKENSASVPGEYITCRQLIDFLGDYVTDELAAGDQHEIARHLAVCPSCVAYLDSYAQTIRLEHAALTDPPSSSPAPLPEDLVRRILSSRRRAANAR